MEETNKAETYLGIHTPTGATPSAKKEVYETCENVIDLRNITKEYKGRKGSPLFAAILRFIDRLNAPPKKERPIDKVTFFLMQKMFHLIKWTGLYATVRSRGLGTPDVRVLGGVNMLVPNKEEGEFIVLLGASGSGKCFTGDTKLKVRNKSTNLIEEISVLELLKRFPHPE